MMRYLLFWLLTLSFAIAQSGRLDFVGPGTVQLDTNRLSGQLLNWDREATPKLVLSAPGSPVRVFADIASDGSFELDLPDVNTIPLGSKICSGPVATVGVFSDILLLTPLDGFTTPTEANLGLSVIGSVYIVDEAFSQAVAQAGSKWIQLMATQADQTISTGACNNSNAFDLKAGWNLVTLTLGPGGGPHTYTAGMDDTAGLYWSAFDETPASNTVSSARPAQLVGSWTALQGDTRISMELGASGEGRIEATEGGQSQLLAGSWQIRTDATFPTGVFLLEAEAGELGYIFEDVDEDNFIFFADKARLPEQALYFSRVGVATHPALFVGTWHNAKDSSSYSFAADGSMQRSDGQSGRWAKQDFQLILDFASDIHSYTLVALTATVIRLQVEGQGELILIKAE